MQELPKVSNRSASASPPAGVDIKRYIRLIQRKKWLITVIFLVMAFLTFVVMVKFGPRPVYTVTTLLQINDISILSAGLGDGVQAQGDSKVGVLTSRTFLGNVVDKQSLALVFDRIDRYAITDSVDIYGEYDDGQYLLQREDGNVKLFYTNEDRDIKNKLIIDKPFPKNYLVEFKGVKIYLKKDWWDHHNKRKFILNRKSKAVENLLGNLTPDFLNPRAKTLLQISYRGDDRALITETLNVLVNEFVKQNLNIKKFHTREVLNILTEQLASAKKDMDAAADKLKDFREKNPWVGLTETSNQSLTEINNAESQKIDVSSKVTELQMLIQRYNNMTGEGKYTVLNEIIAYLAAQDVPTIPALASEFTILSTNRNRLLATHSPSHPDVVENTEKLNSLCDKVMLTANNQLNSFNSQIGNIQSKIRKENFKIQRLPAKEVQYAELQRQKNVADQVFESLLVRHNQAKVSDAVEVGDIIVLDPAVEPLAIDPLSFLLRYIMISIGVGLAVSFGIVFVGDFFDKTVRSSDEIEKIFQTKVLAKIPVIGSEKEVDDVSFNGIKKIDPKLVTADYSPTAMGEEYRSLRTQILFASNHKTIRSLYVTSLNPNEGKSLNTANIAITFAQQKIPTLLIDADLRRGVLHSSFACKKKPGLSDFLYSNSDINDENMQKVIQQTHIPNLYLLSGGIPVPNPSEILGSQRSKDIFKFLSDRFGFVIVDTPPINVTTDSIVISRYVDSGIFVIRAGKTNVKDVKEKVAQFDNFKDNLFGFILNCVEVDAHKNSYKYSYYNY